ncbi:methyl-accepting chemotaxis protein, partial [Caldimonas caldifontis]
AALVEESAAAAESLREQAQRLASVVGTFRLGAQTQPQAPLPSPTAAGAPVQRAASVAEAAIRKAKTAAPATAAAPVLPKAPATPPPAAKAPAASDDNWETF